MYDFLKQLFSHSINSNLENINLPKSHLLQQHNFLATSQDSMVATNKSHQEILRK